MICLNCFMIVGIFSLTLAGFLFAFLIVRIPFTFPDVDVSDDSQARDFIDQTPQEIPQDSLVFMDGDEQVFSLWYAQLAVHRRTDIVFIAMGLFHNKWYIESLARTYPNIKLPEPDQLQPDRLIAANPGRVVCYILAGKPLLCRQASANLYDTSKEPHALDLICLQGKSISFAHRSRLL